MIFVSLAMADGLAYKSEYVMVKNVMDVHEFGTYI